MIFFIRQILAKWIHIFIEAIVFLPVILITGSFLIQPGRMWFWIGSLPLVYLAGILIRSIPGGKRHVLTWLAGIITAACIGYLVTGWSFSLIWAFFSGIFVFQHGIRSRELSWSGSFPSRLYWVGLFLYLITFLFFNKVPGLRQFLPLITWGCLACIAITLVSANTLQLKTATLSKDNASVPPFTALLHNRIFIGVIFTVICAVAGYRQLQKGLSWFFSNLVYWIYSFIMFISSLFMSNATEKASKGGAQLDLRKLFGGTESKGASILDYIVQIIGITLAVAAGIVLLFLIIRTLWKAIGKLVAFIRRFLNLQQENMGLRDSNGYVDEKESMFKLKDLAKNLTDGLKEWMANVLEREPNWKELKDNRERIRYLYRHLLVKCIASGYNFKNHLTPRETGDDLSSWKKDDDKTVRELADLYDLARYGDDEIKDDEVKRLMERQDMHNIK